MKSKVCILVAIGFIITYVAALNIHNNSGNDSKLSFLVLANIEALANDSESSPSADGKCKTEVTTREEAYSGDIQGPEVKRYKEQKYDCKQGSGYFCMDGTYLEFYDGNGKCIGVEDNVIRVACNPS